MLRGGYSKQLVPGYARVVINSYKERPLEGSKITNKKTSKRAYEEDFPVAGFGSLQVKPEGGSVSYQDIVEGNVRRYSWLTYALGFRITHELMSDQLYGVFGNKLSAALGRSARNNQEIVMHAPFNNATSSTSVGWDGVSLANASHVALRSGATFSNTSAVDFGLIALQVALEHFHGLTDESGIPAVFVPKRVIHSVGDYFMVNQILKTPNLPSTNLNDINQVSREGLVPHLSHYLTDTDMWVVQADMHDVNYYVREPFTFRSGDDFNSGDALFKGMQRLGWGHSDWRGVYFGTGA
jgi:hypothetical protein